MQQNYESANAMAARCVDTSARLREFLFNGQELAWTVRRDIATAANLLVDLSIELERGYRGDDHTTELKAPPGTAQSVLMIVRKASSLVTKETRSGRGIPTP
jgi:hypothetical protein